MNPESTQSGEGADLQANASPEADGSVHDGSLLLCLDRIARLQRAPVAQLDLQEAIGELDRPGLTLRQVRKGIGAFARRLGTPAPQWIKRPEPANVPLLRWSAEEGFSVLRGQNAMGHWILDVWNAQEQAWQEQVQPVLVVIDGFFSDLGIDWIFPLGIAV